MIATPEIQIGSYVQMYDRRTQAYGANYGIGLVESRGDDWATVRWSDGRVSNGLLSSLVPAEEPMLDDQLSRDLIEAARESAIGG